MHDSRDPTADGAIFSGHVDVADWRPHAHKRVPGLREPCWCGTVDTSGRKAKGEVRTALIEREPFANVVIGLPRRRLSHRHIERVPQGTNAPPRGNLP